MEDAIYLLVIDVMLVFIALIMSVLAWLITEVSPWVIPVKPFNCRPCCTFWLTLFGCGGAAFYLAGIMPGSVSYALTVSALLPVALLIAVLSFVIINFKYKVYE